MRTLHADPNARDRMGRAARAGFETHWREDRVMAAYGAAFARAAHRRGDTLLVRALEAGAFDLDLGVQPMPI